ncbi:hypothetical protein [Natrinema sp. CGMCC1.2065]|uniref:hypothetical protein n=1 Tax=Natrinema sp. CGMCC1.2065 TaxID=3445767 RepID=UPI003F4A07FE
MMFLVWMGLAFFAGLALYIVMPWTAAKIAGDDWIESVSGTYVWLAQTAAHKSAIVERDGTLELVSKRFDSEILGDKDKEHGDLRHHQDGFSVLSRLKNKSFGVALGDRAEYVSPLLAELGGEAWRAKENDEIGRDQRTVETSGGKKTTESVMRDGILIDKASKLVDVSRARHLTTGDADPEDGHESYLWTEISQEKFNERMSFGQTMVIVLGALGAMVTMFYLTSQTGGSASANAASGGGGGGGSVTDAANNTTTVSMLFILAALSRFDLEWVKSGGRKTAAVLWVVGWIVTWPLTALVMEGLVMALLVAIVMTGVALLLPVGIALLGPSIPKGVGLILARGHWILAQLTVGRGILVRRETGEYEHHKLYRAETSVEETLSARLTNNDRHEKATDTGLDWMSSVDGDNGSVLVHLETTNEVETIAEATLSVTANFENESRTLIDETFDDVDAIKEHANLPVTSGREIATDGGESEDDDLPTVDLGSDLQSSPDDDSFFGDSATEDDGIDPDLEEALDDAEVDDREASSGGWDWNPLSIFRDDEEEDEEEDEQEIGDLVDVEIVLEVEAERDLDHNFVATLADGTELPVHGSEGDLYRFGWAPLGVTEEKGPANMDPITDSPPEDVQADGGRIVPNNTRQGYRPMLKLPDEDDGDQYLVTLPQLYSWCQGTSESETIEQGRDKALSEHGGAQQIGMAVFSVIVLASVVIGGAFGWIAAGGLG